MLATARPSLLYGFLAYCGVLILLTAKVYFFFDDGTPINQSNNSNILDSQTDLLPSLPAADITDSHTPETVSSSLCYDDLGCFPTGYPWKAFGRLTLIPKEPEHINTQFLLYTRKNPKEASVIKAGDVESLRNSHFDGSKKTKFIVHGFLDWGTRGWLTEMAKRFLIHEDVNAFCVDWRGGSQTIYDQAVANTRVVAAEIAKLLKFLSTNTNLNLDDVHVIGHSLGAHIAGYVAINLGSKLGRVTGIDPANPYFQYMDPLVRLDENDAQFVEVLHTDAGVIGFGTWQPSGHVDVYLNGGIQQPGCFANQQSLRNLIPQFFESTILDFLGQGFACSHNRAYDYMTETIGSSCPWRAYKCDNWKEFKTGRCLRCPSDSLNTTCNGVGYQAVKPVDGSVNNIYWVETGDKSPFCRYHFHVKLLTSTKSNKDHPAKLWFNIVGIRASSGFVLATEDKTIVRPNSTYDFMVTANHDLGTNISSVEVKWKHDVAWYNIKEWHIKRQSIYVRKVVVFSAEHQMEAAFCDNSHAAIKSRSPRSFIIRC